MEQSLKKWDWSNPPQPRINPAGGQTLPRGAAELPTLAVYRQPHCRPAPKAAAMGYGSKKFSDPVGDSVPSPSIPPIRPKLPAKSVHPLIGRSSARSLAPAVRATVRPPIQASPHALMLSFFINKRDIEYICRSNQMQDSLTQCGA